MNARNLLLVCLTTASAGFFSACTREPEAGQPVRNEIQGSSCGQNVVVGCYDEFAHEEVSLTCVLPTSRWNKSILTWQLIGRLDNLDEDAQLQAVASAIDVWDAATALSFVQASGNTDITILFVNGSHGDPFPFNQNSARDSNVLGHAFFPSFPGFRDAQDSPEAGDVHISSNEAWALAPDENAIDLFTVVLHELGHALGLPHSADMNAVMFPRYRVEGFRELAQADVTAVARLYGNSDGSVMPEDVAGFQDTCAPANYTDDVRDPDSDGDGLPDSVEVFVVGTDPFDDDTDDDGVSDGVEVLMDRTSALHSNTPDQDDDGLADTREMELGTTLDNSDSDGDGRPDGEELLIGTNPLDPDTDDDCFFDGDDPFPTFVFLPMSIDCTAADAPDDCRANPCDDGLFCNGIEICSAGDCMPGESPCTGDQTCEEGRGCITPPPPCTPELCDDGIFCNGVETCRQDECAAGENPCAATEICDEPTNTCLECREPLDCNDQNACTDDLCFDGTCLNVPTICDDGNACTGDACNVLVGCITTNVVCPPGQTCDPGSGQCICSGPNCE